MAGRFDTAEIKNRISLRDLVAKCGIEVSRSGALWECCCPFHNEKTPSLKIHEDEKGDWYHCFGCGAGGDVIQFWKESQNLSFPDAVEQLARMAGLASGHVAEVRKARVVERPPDAAPVEALGIDDILKWEKACVELYTDREEIDRIAKWRGIRPAVIEWAARRQLVGNMIHQGDWREAFLIQRPYQAKRHFQHPQTQEQLEEEYWGLEPIGWHVRLAPKSRGNNSDKASWRYAPRVGLGAWPFVIVPEGGMEDVKYWFFTEGQWDALALVDLMRWEEKWPAGVGVMGMRGSTSWKRALDYPLGYDATGMLIADNDDAGRGWFVPTKVAAVPFSSGLEKRLWQVFGFWPSEWTGKKDLNDVLRVITDGDRMVVRGEFGKRVAFRKMKRRPGPTFLMWLKRQTSRVGDDAEAIMEFASWAKYRQTPKGRAKEAVWLAFLKRAQASPALMDGFTAAWKQWMTYSALLAREN